MTKGILGIVESWGVDTKYGVRKANPLVKNPYSQGHFGNENSVGAGTKSCGCKEQPH